MAAAAMSIAMAFPAAAATSFDSIDSGDLNLNGSEGFGATITDDLGAFEHSFDFTLDATNLTNTTVGTIILGAKDIDFTSITLDGFSLTQVGFDPSGENWELLGTVLSAGLHTIVVKGSVIGFGTTPGATYTGSLNIAAIPEPATWALMIMGFGSAGYMIRSRRRAMALA
jgi:hypothetical protein